MDFVDERLDKRMRLLLEQLGGKPGASLPAACKGWNETLAAYRFFNNEKVTYQKVLSPNRDATRKRMAGHKAVLCVQDTTEIDFTGRKLKEAGPLYFKSNAMGSLTTRKSYGLKRCRRFSCIWRRVGAGGYGLQPTN